MVSQNKREEIDFFSTPDTYWHKFSQQAYQTLFSNIFASAMRGKVLDAGCGNGVFGANLAKAGFEVVGVDISLASLRVGKKLAHSNRLSIEFIRCDLEHLPFRKETFDVCVCGAVLHHFPMLDKVIMEISSVIKYQGRLIAFEPNGLNPFARILNDSRYPFLSSCRHVTSNERAYTPDELKRALQTNGFEGFTFCSLDNLYVPPFSRDRGSLKRRLISYTFFYLIFPTLGKFLTRDRRGFYMVISCNKSRVIKPTENVERELEKSEEKSEGRE
jgi:2-polyprenyl-3-methyl-5-hydroxy-6-metoxy-1,4-benzoquinol methylase